MTEIEELAALADEARRRNEIHRDKTGDMMCLGRPDDFLTKVEAALRSASRPDAGYVAGFEACVAKVLELKNRWDRAANNDELRSDANRHRHYATAAKLIQQELDALSALPAPATASAGWREITEDNEPPLDTPLLLGYWQEWPKREWVVESGLYGSSRGGWRNGRASHWMPLPPAPTITRKSKIEEAGS